jgi:hypothetical protein
LSLSLKFNSLRAMQKSTVLVFALLCAFACVSQASPPSQEVCARNPSEVNSSPLLKSTMKSFGRASDFFGSWKLGGLAAMFAKVRVNLQATERSFSVQVDDNVPNNFLLCVDPAQPDVFKMRVQKARQPENALILLQARDIGKAVNVANAKTKWKFMKFKRCSSSDSDDD